MNKAGHCYYPKEEHEMEKPSDCVCYWDEEHGIKALQICNKHYRTHILKYYPESKQAQFIRQESEIDQQQMRLL